MVRHVICPAIQVLTKPRNIPKNTVRHVIALAIPCHASNHNAGVCNKLRNKTQDAQPGGHNVYTPPSLSDNMPCHKATDEALMPSHADACSYAHIFMPSHVHPCTCTSTCTLMRPSHAFAQNAGRTAQALARLLPHRARFVVTGPVAVSTWSSSAGWRKLRGTSCHKRLHCRWP